MALSVKNKIWLGTLFLFILLLLTGGVGIYYTVHLKDQTKAVLEDNYETLSYAYTMQSQLDSFSFNQHKAYLKFDSVLKLQEQNITEPGEYEATSNIRANFEQLSKGDTSISIAPQIRNNLLQIIQLNMNAINAKSQRAETAASNAFTYIIASAGIVFIIAFTFIFNFPSIVTKPINALTDAIREIAAKNYRHRIHIKNKDEFGKLADAFNDMAERLESFESSNLNKLMFEKSRAEAVINSLKDASVGIDRNNKLLFANEQALQLLGLKSSEVVGKSVEELKAKNDLFRFLINSDSKVPFKIVVDNRENYFTKEVVEVEQGETKSKVIVIKNITSFKELDVAKTNFIATISHELKTPLASSDFTLKLLVDERTGKLSIEQKELIENLKQDNQRMLKILSELLNMSQVETGKIQLKVVKVDPKQIVRQAVQTVAANAKDKEIKIKDLTDANVPEIQADADKTTWVLNNFLTNAIKYSFNNSSIEIKASQNDGNVVFSVTDSGPGIASEHLHRLFEKYYQVPGSIAKGTGLGLAISKEFVEAQQGKIWVESQIGRGSIFSFQLPIQ